MKLEELERYLMLYCKNDILSQLPVNSIRVKILSQSYSVLGVDLEAAANEVDDQECFLTAKRESPLMMTSLIPAIRIRVSTKASSTVIFVITEMNMVEIAYLMFSLVSSLLFGILGFILMVPFILFCFLGFDLLSILLVYFFMCWTNRSITHQIEESLNEMTP